jgi:hypothetical protein
MVGVIKHEKIEHRKSSDRFFIYSMAGEGKWGGNVVIAFQKIICQRW